MRYKLFSAHDPDSRDVLGKYASAEQAALAVAGLEKNVAELDKWGRDDWRIAAVCAAVFLLAVSALATLVLVRSVAAKRELRTHAYIDSIIHAHHTRPDRVADELARRMGIPVEHAEQWIRVAQRLVQQ